MDASDPGFSDIAHVYGARGTMAWGSDDGCNVHDCRQAVVFNTGMWAPQSRSSYQSGNTEVAYYGIYQGVMVNVHDTSNVLLPSRSYVTILYGVPSRSCHDHAVKWKVNGRRAVIDLTKQAKCRLLGATLKPVSCELKCVRDSDSMLNGISNRVTR